MNNKDFINALSENTGVSPKDAQRLANSFVGCIVDNLEEGNAMTVQGFGNFEVKKKMERVIVNPKTKQRLLIPPKLVFSFKPSNVLKERCR